MWSFSNGRLFNKCQRAWFYKNHVANANATKNPLQREAYVLSKLQTVAAWRGNLVDHVISARVVPALEKGWNLNAGAILQYARSLFERQWAFATAARSREPGMSQSKAGEDFAAFYAVEYGIGVSEEDKDKAWVDVETALQNLLGMREVLDDLRRAERLIAQRNLMFSVFQAKARAVPDLIAFYRDEPPLIVDWKVHSFGMADYRLQLTAYALGLLRCPPHQDFPSSLAPFEPEDVRLIEVQLLKGVTRPYKLESRDVEAVESHILESFLSMSMAEGDTPTTPRDVFDYPVTEYPETCVKCQFRKLCWEEPVCRESRQMTLL